MKPRLKYVLIAGLLVLGAWIAAALAQDSMADFGLKVNELEERIVESLAKGYLPAYPDKKVFKTAPPSVQATFVRNSLSWLKTYTATDAFKADYANRRVTAKPAPLKSTTADEKQALFLAEQRRDLEKTKQNIAQMPPDMQKQMQEVVKQMEDNIEKSAKDPQMAAIMKESYEKESLTEQQNHQEIMAAWEKQYPEDPQTLIATRLHQFLEVSQDIDFDAKLVPVGPKSKVMKFADPQYEAQTPEWKLCYRAGREPVQAARAFVSEWLSQIEK
jgi:hypothetical protein